MMLQINGHPTCFLNNINNNKSTNSPKSVIKHLNPYFWLHPDPDICQITAKML